ncbi:MAG: TolC family protein, partial [candidate division WOR-3 bacterium]
MAPNIITRALYALTLALALTSADTIDLNLDQALTIALKNGPLRGEIAASRIQGITSFGEGINALLPAATASFFSVTQKGNPTLWKGDITIQQVLFDPSVFASLINSIINADYYSCEVKDKTARLLCDVTTDYLNLLKAQLLFDASRKTLEQAKEEKRLTTERFRLGQISRIDLLRSEVFYTQAQLGLLSAEKNLINAQEMFKATAGINQPLFIRATEQISSPPEWQITDPDSLLILIERTNPNRKMAQKLSTIAGINLTSTLCRLLPSVSLYRTWGYSDTLFPFFSSYKEKSSITQGIRISLPVDIKAIILNIGDALAGSKRARATLAKTRLQLRATAGIAIAGYEEAKTRYEQAKRNLELNKELEELALTQYRLGALPFVELLEVQANLAQA